MHVGFPYLEELPYFFITYMKDTFQAPNLFHHPQLALDHTFSLDEVRASIKTRLRAETAPLVDYLLSRSVAGATHHDLIQGATELTKGAIKAKFFHMFPKRAVQLSRWLAQWISRGEDDVGID